MLETSVQKSASPAGLKYFVLCTKPMTGFSSNLKNEPTPPKKKRIDPSLRGEGIKQRARRGQRLLLPSQDRLLELRAGQSDCGTNLALVQPEQIWH